MSTPAVSVRAVSKVFATRGDDVHALQDVSIEVDEGEFITLIGPSGCGKSTLLNLVAGLLPATSGEVLVRGRPVMGPPDEVGMMFQKPVLLEWRTILDNVLLPIEIAGGRRAARSASDRAMDLLHSVGLNGFEKRYPRELSGGMQQRAAVCRMLIGDPEVLLMDEPFGALDELTREKLNLQFDRIVEQTKKTSILVTHNIQEGVFLSDRVVVMSARPGRIIGVVPVSLPRPRTLDMVTTGEFLSLTNAVRHYLEVGSASDGSAA